MASNQTTNYGLNQWEATDQVLRADFNADNSKIDAALKGLAEKGTALEEKDSLLETAISQCGNCRMEAVQFTGNGTDSVSIAFSQKPDFFVVVAGRAMIFVDSISNSATTLQYDSAIHGAAIGSQSVSWSGGTATLDIGSNLQRYFNLSGTTYHALAFYMLGNS